MAENKTPLLGRLKALYHDLFALALQRRLHHYHEAPSSTQSLKIEQALHRFIDEVIGEASHHYSAEDYRQRKLPEALQAWQKSQTSAVALHPDVIHRKNNGLSAAFESLESQETEPHMATTLKGRVWDHVHSAHRYARAGETRLARLHAELASEAMHTLSHYLSEAEYAQFYRSLQDELSQLVQSGADLH